MAGTFTSNQLVDLRKVVLPEFNRSVSYDCIDARIIHGECNYDIIFGRKELREFKLNLDFENDLVARSDFTLPMRPRPGPQD